MAQVFISGATGYMGRALASALCTRGHDVRGLVRPGSESKLPANCAAVVGSALDASTFASALRRDDTFVQLVGTPKPNPFKGDQFRAIDLVAGLAAIRACATVPIEHFVYVSVAQPAPIMKDYIAVRSQCETAIANAGLNATVLRPWYVLGPGHWWPYALLPVYGIAERVPAWRDSARRLGLVTLDEMVAALVYAVEHPARGLRYVNVRDIRAAARPLKVASRAA